MCKMKEVFFFCNYIEGIPGTTVKPWCFSIKLLRLRCCSKRWTAALSCEFSTYKSFTNISAFAKRWACSAIIMLCCSNLWRSSLISADCCCHVSEYYNSKINFLFTMYYQFYLYCAGDFGSIFVFTAILHRIKICH